MMADQENVKETENNTIDCHDSMLSPTNMTNFSISEIMKPDFGIKKFKVQVSSTIAPVDNNCNSTPRVPELHPEGKVPDSARVWPAWVYCTRYSDRPSSGPRSRKIKKREKLAVEPDDKRPRTAFTNEQLQRLKCEFEDCRYLTEQRRKSLATSLSLTEAQIKIWFQNKRAKLKKSSGLRNPLALHLMAQGLYNHSTCDDNIDVMS